MDFLKQNLGPNKVSINIKSNQFDETIAINNFENDDIKSKFNDFDNIIDIYRGSKMPQVLKEPQVPKASQVPQVPVKKTVKTPVKAPVKEPPQVLQTSKEFVQVLQTPQVSQSQEEIYDKLFYIIYSTTDELMTLLRPDDLNKRIDKFKDEMIKNLFVMYKKLELNKLYKEVEIINAIKNHKIDDRLPLITYFSRLLNKCIFIEYKTGNIIIAKNDYSKDGFYIKETNDDFVIEDNFSREDLLNQMITRKKEYYIKNDYLTKVDKLLVKDLKDIAESLLIPVLKLKKAEILQNIKDYLKN
jgi:hypothetical protein